jgi:cytochrome bd-type quinol oxidase subunit 2
VRATSALTVLWAWAAAQNPDLLVGSLTVADGAAPTATLDALVETLAFGSLLLLPSLGLLFWLIRRPIVPPGSIDTNVVAEPIASRQAPVQDLL